MRGNVELARQWESEVCAWEVSGQSVAAYCREKSLSVWKLHYWRKRLRQPSVEPGGFVEVELAEDQCSGLRIALGDDLDLVIERDFDASTLSRVLSVVRGR